MTYLDITKEDWITSAHTVTGDSTVGINVKAPPAAGYDIKKTIKYYLLLNTEYDPNSNNGVERPGPGIYRFFLEAFKGVQVFPELHTHYDFLLGPKPDNTL